MAKQTNTKAAALVKGAIAALSQPKVFPGDITLAKDFLKQALREISK